MRVDADTGIVSPSYQRSRVKPGVVCQLLHDELRDVAASHCPAMDAGKIGLRVHRPLGGLVVEDHRPDQILLFAVFIDTRMRLK